MTKISKGSFFGSRMCVRVDDKTPPHTPIFLRLQLNPAHWESCTVNVNVIVNAIVEFRYTYSSMLRNTHTQWINKR